MNPPPIPAQLVADTISYLQQQPWIQVNGLMQGWMTFWTAAAAPPPPAPAPADEPLPPEHPPADTL